MLRAVAFSRFAREPMLVGGQMLSLQVRSQLSTMGEVVDRHKFLWRNAPQTEPHHDLAERPLRQTAVAAPAGGRRLQRLVDVPDPAGRRRGHRAAAAAVHQVGRRRVRPAGPVARLPDGDGAGHRDLAHVVPREGRHQRLAGLLPLPQPARGGRDARPGRPEGPAHRHPQAHRPAPHAHGVLGRGAAAQWRCATSSPGPRRCSRACPWCWARSARPARSTTTGARWTRRRRSRRAAWTRSRRRPSRCRPPPSRPSSRPWPAASSATCAPRTRRITRCRSATCRRGRPSGSCCPRSTRRRSRPRTAAASPSAAATRSCSAAQLKTSAQLLGTAAREWPALRRRYREAAPHLTSREGWKQIFES